MYAPRLQSLAGRDQELSYIGQHGVKPIGSVDSGLPHQPSAFGLCQQIIHSIFRYYRLSVKIHKLRHRTFLRLWASWLS
jgi:hypothetical protein